MAGGPKNKKQDNHTSHPKTEKAKAKYNIFVLSYLENGNNATQAAKSAGYSEKTARQQGQRLLSNVYIQEQIKIKQKELEENYTVSLKSRLETLEKVVEEGLKAHFDACGNKRPLGLQQVVNAVDKMNQMLGTVAPDEEAKPMSISFNIAAPKAEMTVTNAAPA